MSHPITIPADVGIGLLATMDDDLCLLDRDDAEAQARVLAEEEGRTIWLRDPLTDAVLGRVDPINVDRADLTDPAMRQEMRDYLAAVRR